MNDEEMRITLEEMGDCFEDMARSVDRMRKLMKTFVRGMQEMKKNLDAVNGRLSHLEDAAEAPKVDA